MMIIRFVLTWLLAVQPWLGLQPAQARVRAIVAQTVFISAGGIVSNMNPMSFFANVRPFVNWAQQGGARTFNLATSGTASELTAFQSGYVDNNGELIGGSAISAIKSVNVSLFTFPGGSQNYSAQLGPTSAMITGTISGTTLTVTNVIGTIKQYDQLQGSGVTGLATPTNIQAFGTGGTTGTGGLGTYSLTQSSTVASPVTMTTTTYWWTGLQMTIAWAGGGVSSVTANGGGAIIGTGGSLPTCTASPCTMTWGYNPSNFSLAFNFTAGAASPPTKIQVFQTQYATQMAACAAATQPTAAGYGQCFAPDWLSQQASFGFHRNMDWMATNQSGITDISQLADFNYIHLATSTCPGSVAIVNGTISGTTVTFASSQTLGTGAHVQDPSGLVSAGTVIASADGAAHTTYTVNNSQTVSSATGSITTTSSSAVVTVNSAPSSTISPYMSLTDSGSLISTSGGPTVILPYGTGGTTGTGGAGTYMMSRNSNAAGTSTGTFSIRMYVSAAIGWIGTTFGTKCGVHPMVMAALANLVNTNPWFVFPASFTVASATAVGTYMRDNVKLGLVTGYENCNEDWNAAIGVCFAYLQAIGTPTFNCGTCNLPAAGYLASQFFSAISSVYGAGARSRWMGMVSGQMVVNFAVPQSFVSGFTQWKTNTSSSLNVWDLFDFVAVAPYESDFPTSQNVTAVTTGATATVTMSSTTGYANGQRKRLFFSVASGLSAYNNMDVTVAGLSGLTFQFSDFSTTGTFTATGSNWAAEAALYDMFDASAACYASASASISAGSITGTAFTAGGSVTGAISVGQGLTGVAGIPANTYINSGSGTSWVLNNSVTGTVTGAMTTTPCATKYQFFAQQYTKKLITGSNDYSYVGNSLISANTFPTMYQQNALYAGSQGLALFNYEGLFQIVPGAGTALSSDPTANDYFLNFKYDAAGSDPLYTPAKVFDTNVSLMASVYNGYSAVFQPDSFPSSFGTWLYPTDANPLMTEIKTVNAAGPYVDPTPAATWSTIFNAADKNFASGSGTTLTCPVTSTSAGLMIVVASQASGNPATSVTIDGNAVSTPDTPAIAAAWKPTIWSHVVSAGAHTISITWGVASVFRSCTSLIATGLHNNTVQGSGAQAQSSVTLPVTKGSLIVGVSASPFSNNMQSASTASGRIAGCPSVCSNVTVTDLISTQDFIWGYWAPGPTFSSPVFNVQQSGNGMTAASYNFLLKRDLDPASNDNDPMWLEKAA